MGVTELWKAEDGFHVIVTLGLTYTVVNSENSETAINLYYITLTFPVEWM